MVERRMRCRLHVRILPHPSFSYALHSCLPPSPRGRLKLVFQVAQLCHSIPSRRFATKGKAKVSFPSRENSVFRSAHQLCPLRSAFCLLHHLNSAFCTRHSALALCALPLYEVFAELFSKSDPFVSTPSFLLLRFSPFVSPPSSPSLSHSAILSLCFF